VSRRDGRVLEERRPRLRLSEGKASLLVLPSVSRLDRRTTSIIFFVS
jgi:hypothetical protein